MGFNSGFKGLRVVWHSSSICGIYYYNRYESCNFSWYLRVCVDLCWTWIVIPDILKIPDNIFTF